MLFTKQAFQKHTEAITLMFPQNWIVLTLYINILQATEEGRYYPHSYIIAKIMALLKASSAVMKKLCFKICQLYKDTIFKTKFDQPL